MRRPTLSTDDKLNSIEINSFSGGYKQIELPSGFVLWRFISQVNYKKFSSFWIDASTMEEIMQTFHANSKYDIEYKKYIVSQRLAILDDWSNLNWRVKVVLKKRLTAYVGLAAPKHSSQKLPNSPFKLEGGQVEKATGYKLGFTKQIVVPRLRGLDDNNQYASVEHFSHI